MLNLKLAATIFALSSGFVIATKPGLPNFVFLLADDLGQFEIGYNNPQVITPNINNLAASGVTLLQHYTYQYCSPTRTALLTGRYPYKAAGTRTNIAGPDIDGPSLGFTFLPQRLKEAGYATHHVGKWHLGFADYRYTATARGFDSSDGFFTGAQNHFNQTTLELLPAQCSNVSTYPNSFEIFVNGAVDYNLIGEHNTYRFKQRAVNIINEHVQTHGLNSVPLFLYVPFNTPHRPIQADQEYKDLYPGISYNLQRTVFGMVSDLDFAVGDIVAALKTTGLWENTILVWTSDNGK